MPRGEGFNARYPIALISGQCWYLTIQAPRADLLEKGISISIIREMLRMKANSDAIRMGSANAASILDQES